MAIHNFKNWNGKIILDVIEKETISKIKKVIDSHFIVAIGEKSILIWNTLNDFNLNNEFGLVSILFFLSRNLFSFNKYMGRNLFRDFEQID